MILWANPSLLWVPTSRPGLQNLAFLKAGFARKDGSKGFPYLSIFYVPCHQDNCPFQKVPYAFSLFFPSSPMYLQEALLLPLDIPHQIPLQLRFGTLNPHPCMFRQCFYIPSGLPLHASTSVGFPLCLSFAKNSLFVHAGLLTFAFLLRYRLPLSLEVVILENQPAFLNFFFLLIS